MAIFFIPCVAHAQECVIIKFKNNIDLDLTASNYLSYTSVFRSEQHSESDGSDGIGFGAVVKKAPIKIDYSKSEYDSHHSSLYRETAFTQNRETSVAFIGNLLSPEGRKAYLACLQNHQEGVSAAVLSADNERVSVLFSYKKGVGDGANASIEVEFRGALGNPETNIVIPEINGKLVEYARSPNSEFRIGLLSANKSIVGPRELKLNRQFQLPEGGRLLLVQAWADAESYETAPTSDHRYRSQVMFLRACPVQSVSYPAALKKL